MNAEGEKAVKKAFCRIFRKSEKLKWGEETSQWVCVSRNPSDAEKDQEPFSVAVSTNLPLSLPGEDAAPFLLVTATFLLLSNVFKFVYIEVYKSLSAAWDGLQSCEPSFACCSSYNVFSALHLHWDVLKTLPTNEVFRAVVLCGLLHLPHRAEGFLECTVIFWQYVWF